MIAYRAGLGLLPLVGLCVSSSVGAGPLPLRELAREQATVIMARSVGPRLPYSVFVGGKENKGSIEAGSGYRLIAIELTLEKEHELALTDTAVVLAVPSGGRYRPLGYAPISLKRFIAFQAFSRGEVMVGVAEQLGFSYSVSREAEVMNFRLRGTNDTKFTLVFEVPINERQFTLSLADSKPMPIELLAE